MPQDYPLIRTKTIVPRLRDSLVPRQRLVDLLHSNIHNKLVLISAGAGYGKTSLLNQYAHDAGIPVCWYSLDENDNSLGTFSRYLVRSIQEQFPAFGQSVLTYLQDVGALADVEPLVGLFLQEIESHANQFFALLLDDYHQVIQSEPVNALLDGLLRYLPDQCHIVLASRGVPRRLTLSRLAARQEIAGFGASELCFNSEEIRMLLANMGHLDLDEKEIEAIAQRTEGWVTGIILTAQTSLTDSVRDILHIVGSNEGVFDYLAEEILSQQTHEVQEFLLATSLFQQMTPSLCNALLDIDQSSQILRYLVEENLFTVSLDAGSKWYEYHQLFREFLRTRLEREDPELFRALCLKQAQLVSTQGDWAQAISSYLTVQAYEQAAEALEIVVQEGFVSGDYAQLDIWFDQFTDQLLNKHPRLLLFRSRVATERGNATEAERIAQQAYAAACDLHDDASAARSLVQLAVLRRFQGKPAEAISFSEKALALVDPQDLITAEQAHRDIGISLCMQGDMAGGVEELEKALEIAISIPNETEVALISADIGSAEIIRGHLEKARRHYHQSLLYWRRTGNDARLAHTLQSLGLIHHYMGQYAEAENRFEESLNKAKSVSDLRIQAYALTSLGDMYRDMRRYDQASTEYELAYACANEGALTPMISYAMCMRGDTLRLKGELDLAHQVLLEAQDQLSPEEMPFEQGICDLAMGAYFLETSNLQKAEDHLRHALELLQASNSTRDVARTHLYLANLAYKRGQREELDAQISNAVSYVQALGTSQFIVAESVSMIDMLYACSHERQGRFDFAEIFNAIDTLIHKPALDINSILYQISLLSLDNNRILKDNALVTDWESEIAKLMVFLFAENPTGLRRDRVIDLLWPEATPARGNSLFHSTLYRLRSSLGKDFIIHSKGLYLLNPDISCYYDTRRLQECFAQGRNSGDMAHIARQEALNIYHTPFLDPFDLEWCTQKRDQLHAQMLELVISEALYQLHTGDMDTSESLFIRARGLEPFDERAYRGVMWCRASRNDRAGALREYKECEVILAKELDVEPSLETLELYDAITNGVPLPPLE